MHLAHMLLSAHQQHALHPPLQAKEHPTSPTPSSHSSTSSLSESPLVPFHSQPDEFGLFRIYANEPTYVPLEPLEVLTNAPTLLSQPSVFDIAAARARLGVPIPELSAQEFLAPFSNPSSGILMAYQYSGSSEKSESELDRLTQLLFNPLFDPQDLAGFSHSCEVKKLDKYLESENSHFRTNNGWHKSSIKIRLPKERAKFQTKLDAPEILVDGIWHHNLTEIITDAFQNDLSMSFHMTPFTQRCRVSEDKVVDVYSEAYSSHEMRHAYEEVNSLPREPGDETERIVASLMLWSDATHLTNFGNASMWLFYLFFGNESKYTRCKPVLMSCHHLAYIPKVSPLLWNSRQPLLTCFCSYQMTSKMFTEVFMERHHQRASTHTVNANFSKRFGLCSSMRSLWKPTIMESWYDVQMESSLGSIHTFSHTLLTILKSKY